MTPREKLIKLTHNIMYDRRFIADDILAAGWTLAAEPPKEDPVEKLAKEIYDPDGDDPNYRRRARHVRRLLRDAKLEGANYRSASSPCYCQSSTGECRPCRETRAAILTEFSDVTDEPSKDCTSCSTPQAYTECTTNPPPNPIEEEAKRLWEAWRSSEPQLAYSFAQAGPSTQCGFRALARDNLTRMCAAEIAATRERCGSGCHADCSTINGRYKTIQSCGRLQKSILARYPEECRPKETA
jgi:hypothetical protein